MQDELQISFQGIDPSPALEACIRDRATRLERFDDRITSCHVVVQAPHQNRDRHRRYDVQVLIDVPGGKLVVDRRGLRNDADRDPHVVVNDAFRAAERLLKDHVRRLEPHTHAPRNRISIAPARRH